MALRRPPTRIELKADDVEEYDKIMKERKSLAEQLAMKEQGTKQENTPNNKSHSFSFGVSPVSSQKKSASERIYGYPGYLGPR
mmetsp:Transcript_27862/g.43815  ORF Transcript_27862/g.43815 Transcript_27862/m.43815 type:complete len:83 (+) Transcript_27862:78-326(+)|eukprot:CAMPEP_0201727546 /NCGR_PEP_ID=MMETSP0593-20130828/12680_1 /ASSEMBLY_ACC=CAM_ASM_000672 /TAXON_ID=267983 /ORGANISM="Skeletonema japonicum, Strain CCMP2506" /LENGTH=82 /DNA_ID=CAMNT_0048219383 /DNA_START=63 /DNA_END=311 /DNA_ORIENTATION=-